MARNATLTRKLHHDHKNSRIVNFEHTSDLYLVFLLLTLNK